MSDGKQKRRYRCRHYKGSVTHGEKEYAVCGLTKGKLGRSMTVRPSCDGIKGQCPWATAKCSLQGSRARK